MRPMRTVLGLLAALTLLPSVALTAGGGLVGTLKDDALDESSGLVASRLHPGVFWTHNDSGSEPRLFAIDATGAAKGQVKVTGAPAVDWEDLAADDSGHLWIHDGGNNKNRRKDLTVIRVPEPTALAGEVAADRVIAFHYPEQTEFPPASRNFDSEALYWDGGRLMLLTKHRSDTRTVLYVFPAGFQDDPRYSGVSAPGVSVPLTKLGEFDVGGAEANFGGQVSGADISRDGRRLAVLTYHGLFVFERPDGDGPVNWLGGAQREIRLVQLITQQCEAIAWDGDALLFTNEGRAVMRINNPSDPACVLFPSPGCR